MSEGIELGGNGCEDDLELQISRYLDGELSDHERDQLEARLRDDKEARAMLQEQLTVHAALGALGAVRGRALRRRRALCAFAALLGILALFVIVYALAA